MIPVYHRLFVSKMYLVGFNCGDSKIDDDIVYQIEESLEFKIDETIDTSFRNAIHKEMKLS